MPLVSHEWASALSGHSFAWEELELSHPPQNWSKLVGWAATHCKHTHQLTLEDITSGSEEALQKLLACFLALRTVKLTGRISSSPTLWSHLLVHRLQHLHIELNSIKQADIDGISLMHGLQHVSLQVSPSAPPRPPLPHHPPPLFVFFNNINMVIAVTLLSTRQLSTRQRIINQLDL